MILGLQSGLIRLNKFTKLRSVGEQPVPLFQIEGDWKSTETVHRDGPFLRHFETKATALGQTTFQFGDSRRHLLRSQVAVCFIGHRLILILADPRRSTQSIAEFKSALFLRS